MARHSRVILPNVAIHIVQRGNNRIDCFKADSDRLVYLSVLRELSLLTYCAIHAYCLMTNHVHLLITPDTEERTTTRPPWRARTIGMTSGRITL